MFLSRIGMKSTELYCRRQEELLLSCAKANRILINNETQYLEMRCPLLKSREMVQPVISLSTGLSAHNTFVKASFVLLLE